MEDFSAIEEEGFRTTHDLAFEVAPWLSTDEGYFRFRIGTCDGLWGSTESCYLILAVRNSEPGNGHFEDVLEWFEHSCVRDGKYLRVQEIWNHRLKVHLLESRGFVMDGNDDVIKVFSDKWPIKFAVEYRTFTLIEGDSFEEARDRFQERFPDFTAVPESFTKLRMLGQQSGERLGSKKVVGICEISGKAIFADESYESDDHGRMWLSAMARAEIDPVEVEVASTKKSET